MYVYGSVVFLAYVYSCCPMIESVDHLGGVILCIRKVCNFDRPIDKFRTLPYIRVCVRARAGAVQTLTPPKKEVKREKQRVRDIWIPLNWTIVHVLWAFCICVPSVYNIVALYVLQKCTYVQLCHMHAPHALTRACISYAYTFCTHVHVDANSRNMQNYTYMCMHVYICISVKSCISLYL